MFFLVSYSSSHSFSFHTSAPDGFDMLNHQVGSLNTVSRLHICIEADLRSAEKEERTLHMFLDNTQSPLFFYGVPESVKMGVFFLQPASIEFESFEEVRESAARQLEGEYGYKFEGEEVKTGDRDDMLVEE